MALKSFLTTREKMIFELLVDNYSTEEIAEKLDIPTPVVLDKHIIDFTVYKNTRFFTDDFVESVNFEKLVLENIG